MNNRLQLRILVMISNQLVIEEQGLMK